MAGSPNDRGALLHIAELSKAYGKNSVIASLTVTFPSKGIHFIAGDNGAGKTTFFKCIAGLETYRGSITWDQKPAADYISVAFDDAPAHNELTGLQNLSAVLDVRLNRLRSDPSTFQFLSRGRLDKKTKSYSLGQRKKLSLTAAFLDTRPCILLDEPTSGLDASGRMTLRDQLEHASQTRCVIISDHYVDFYAGLATTSYSAGPGGLRRVPIGSLALAADERADPR